MQTIKVLAPKIVEGKEPRYWLLKEDGNLSLNYVPADNFAEWSADVTNNGNRVEVVTR